MKITSTKLKRIGKRTISLLLSVLLVFQIMDFSVLSISAAEESGEPQTSQNEQTDPVEEEPEEESEVSQEESEPESSIEQEPAVYSDWTVSNSYTLSEDKEVNNISLTGGTLNLNGKVLTVHGYVEIDGGNIVINRGVLNCKGNFYLHDFGSLVMNQINDRVIIDGDLLWFNGISSNITDGTIELKGNFVDNYNHYDYDESSTGSFVTYGSTKFILSGDSEQYLYLNKYCNYSAPTPKA